LTGIAKIKTECGNGGHIITSIFGAKPIGKKKYEAHALVYGKKIGPCGNKGRNQN
jgi:hypothetical protein